MKNVFYRGSKIIFYMYMYTKRKFGACEIYLFWQILRKRIWYMYPNDQIVNCYYFYIKKIKKLFFEYCKICKIFFSICIMIFLRILELRIRSELYLYTFFTCSKNIRHILFTLSLLDEFSLLLKFIENIEKQKRRVKKIN